jgi:signal transduction histidine kinase
VLADRDGLAAALINLLDNALKYSRGEPRITVSAQQGGDSLVAFAVADNGIGIAPREQRRIFRRFYRVDQRLSRETSGVGLGLSIVDLIAREHGGRVTVRSSPGAGSTFTLTVRQA